MLVIITILMGIILDRIRDELLSWPDVTAEPHRFGGLEFRLHKRELGHIQGDRLADLPFPMDTRKNLLIRVVCHLITYYQNQAGLATGSLEEKMIFLR
jgi:Family of unknown function (DUF5519)